MGISKRCKICTALEASNIPISGEYFGRSIPGLITKISGIELEPLKMNGILICQQCSIMLVYTEGVVDKLRKNMQRLQKINKVAKTPRTTLKETSETEAPKKSGKMKPAQVKGDIGFRKVKDGTTPLNEIDVIPVEVSPTKNAKRKLAYQEDIGPKEAANSGSAPEKFKRTADILDNSRNCRDLHILDSVDTSITELGKSNGREKEISDNSIPLNHEIESNTEEMDKVTMDDQNFKETKTKDLNCVLCGKQFNQKRTLREHIESRHMGEKLKECPNCFTEFRSVQKYDSHVFSEKCKTTLYPCQFENCNRRFKNSHKMEQHMKDKHFSIDGTETD